MPNPAGPTTTVELSVPVPLFVEFYCYAQFAEKPIEVPLLEALWNYAEAVIPSRMDQNGVTANPLTRTVELPEELYPAFALHAERIGFPVKAVIAEALQFFTEVVIDTYKPAENEAAHA